MPNRNDSIQSRLEEQSIKSPEALIHGRSRLYIIVAALLALFLDALDALIIETAMPTTVSDRGLLLYSG